MRRMLVAIETAALPVMDVAANHGRGQRDPEATAPLTATAASAVAGVLELPHDGGDVRCVAVLVADHERVGCRLLPGHGPRVWRGGRAGRR